MIGPDTIAYATMAKNIFSEGLLYIPSWGHIDHGLILPPLFPILTACGRFFCTETLTVAEYITSICVLMSSIPIFLYLKHMTNRIVAIITTIMMQVNCYYFIIGMRPISEATFLLTLSFTLYLLVLMINNIERERKLTAFWTGLLCALIFLSRHIGIIMPVFVMIIFFIHWLTVSGRERRILYKNLLFILLGWLIVFTPYAIILYSQTGQHPLTQGFRENKYTITVKDPEILRQIENYKTLPAELRKQIESASNADYGLLYAERRRMRKLLPDASEMYAYINYEKEKEAGYLSIVFSNISKPVHYFTKFYNNIVHLTLSMGKIPTILFFIMCLSSFLVKPRKIRFTTRLLLPFFIIFYLLSISFLTDLIPRYIYVIFPFCLIHISTELYIGINALAEVCKMKRFSTMITSLLIIFLLLLTTPRFFTDLTLSPKNRGLESEYHFFKKYLNGDPVFTLRPVFSYIAGGSFRILPDDSLAKVAAYGKNTGVRWLLIVRIKIATDQLRFYSNTQWYFERSLEKAYPNILKFRIGTTDGSMALYEIL
jgi:4-amino-4-deoxy-L-arabinose transferase-like glycosyltransferase